MNDSSDHTNKGSSRLAPYQQVERDLRSKIKSGYYAPGAILPSRRALAAEYGIALRTLERSVANLIEEGLLRPDGRRGTYVPGAHDDGPPRNYRATRGEQTRVQPAVRAPIQTIAVVAFHAQYFSGLPSLLKGVQHTLRAKQAPYKLVIFDTNGDNEEESIVLERKALQSVEQDGISGVILWHEGGDATVPDVQRLYDARIPVVFVDRYPVDLPCDFVGVDDVSGAQAAVGYLTELGHRRIAMLTFRQVITTVEGRMEGYRDALIAAGINPASELVYKMRGKPPPNPDVTAAIDYFLAMPEPPTAIFGVNDLVAHAALVEVEARGIRVPDEISILGFDDFEQYSPLPRRLSTVHLPLNLIGRRACDLLLQRLASNAVKDRPHQHIVLPTSLIVSTTTKPPQGAVVRPLTGSRQL